MLMIAMIAGLGSTSARSAVLSHYWSLDGASDTGADVGGATLSVSDSLGVQTSTADRFGRAGRAMDFANDAGGLTYNVPDGQRIDDLGTYTVAGWVLNENPSGAHFERIAEGAFGTDFYLGTDVSGSLNYSAISSSTVNPRAIGGTISGGWQLVAMTYSAGIVDLYVNGAFVDGGTGTDPEEFTQLGIGAAPNGAADWNGLIDDVSIWNGPMTSTEVNALHSLSANSGIRYTPVEVGMMFDLLDQEADGAVGTFEWTYTTGLSGTPGQITQQNNTYTLVMDGGTGFTGFDAAVVPEPTSALYMVTGSLLISFLRRWRPRR